MLVGPGSELSESEAVEAAPEDRSAVRVTPCATRPRPIPTQEISVQTFLYFLFAKNKSPEDTIIWVVWD